MFNKYYTGLMNIKLFPDLLLGIFLSAVFSGCFFMDTSLHRLFSYAAVIFGLYFISTKKQWKEAFYIKDHVYILAIMFVAFALLSLFWSENMDAERVWQKIKPAIFIPLTLTIYMYYCTYYSKAYSVFLELFLLASVLTGALLLVMNAPFIINSYTDSDTVWRLNGLGRAENQNQAGLLYGIAFLCFLFYKPKIISAFDNKAIKSICAVIVGLVFFLTLSRGAFFGCAGTLILTLMLRFYIMGFDKKTLLASLVFLSASIFMYMFIFSDVATYMVNRGSTGRFEIWASAWEQYKESIWWGRGIGTKFIYDIPPYKPVGHVHSLYFSTLLHLGAIGFTIFIALVASVWLRTIKLAKNTKDYALFIIVTYGCIFGLVDTGGHYNSLSNSWTIFWIPIALLITKAQSNKAKL